MQQFATIGDMIRKYRQRRGMTKADLAFAVGVKDSTIYEYETGRRTPSVDMVLMIANALDLELRLIVNEKGVPHELGLKNHGSRGTG